MNEQPFLGNGKIQHNRLINEKSPYLLQHAQNPVDWYPWNEEAFEEAKRLNKPIFLSIGYSTCHWCHVMAHESFEDPEIAGLMNNAFICIKVDREERPDIDMLYMSVCQLMTGRGGWPLTIIMTPDKKPFFAGTYLPRESRFGVTGLIELIPQIKKIWEMQDSKLFTYADQIVDALRGFNGKPSSEGLDETILKETYELLAQFYDKRFGGFGRAPKFPTPHNILFLLRYWRRTGIDAPLKMAEKTLRSMRQGGIYDHIGFGFHRYSTDSGWLLPHFEKMLYDQALLTMAYTEAYQATKNKEYQQTAHEILTYVLREMTAPEGGFYSAEDADSEGEEGKFYLWTYDEVLRVLQKEEADLIVRIFNLSPKGNFREAGAEHKNAYNNIFHMEKTFQETASTLGMSIEELGGRVKDAREKLFTFRKNRVHPNKDGKILTDWNGLMIAALARAGRIFDEPVYKKAAICAADFIMTNMNSSDGLLLHRYREGQAEITGYLDDYAFLIWGLLELFESTFEASYLKYALKLQNDLERHFWDRSAGGFFFTSDVSEDLLVRQKELYDGAVPAGNSISILNLLRLAHITANPHFLEQASAIERIFSKKVKENPAGYTQFMVALDFAFGPSFEVFITGNSLSDDTKKMLRGLQTNFIPNTMIIFRPSEQNVSYIDEISPFLRNCKTIGGKATAYVCQNNACNKPTTDVGELLEMLNVRNCRN